MKSFFKLFMSLALMLTLIVPAASAKTTESNPRSSPEIALHVQIVLFDGFDLLDVMGPYEVFASAAMYSDGAVSVELVSSEGKRSVPSGLSGPSLEAEAALDPSLPGIILVPGASGKPAGQSPDSVQNVLARTMKTALPGKLKSAMDNKQVTVATDCGGSLLLAMQGLLKGKYAVTNRLGMDALEAMGAMTVDARVVEDNPRLVTGGGVTSGIDVALYLVERELGPQIANAVEGLFEYERRGTVWKSDGRKPIDFAVNPSADRDSQAAVTDSNEPA